MNNIPHWLNFSSFGNPIWKYAVLFVIGVVGIILKRIFSKLYLIFIKRVNKNKSSWFDKLIVSIQSPAGLLLTSGFWFFSILFLEFNGRIEFILLQFTIFILGISIIWIFFSSSEVLSEYLYFLAKLTDTPFDDSLIPLFRRVIKIFIVTFGVLLLAHNMGVNVSSLIAGLGLGGLAFALAAKDTCANFFSFIMIVVDQPFKLGDTIKVGDIEGEVEDMGFRSTRLRTANNSVVSIPNSSLTNLNVDNITLRKMRRLKSQIGVSYSTSTLKLETFINDVKKYLNSNSKIYKDDITVIFDSIGSTRLEILIDCYLLAENIQEEQSEKQKVLIGILKIVENNKIELSYPSHSIHLNNQSHADLKF